MFKVTISGEVDEDEEYVKEILALENRNLSLADIDNPLPLTEMLLDACNTRPVTVSVEKV